MMFGIPYVFFVLEFSLVVLIFVNTKNLLMFLLIIPVHTIAYGLTVRDARFVDVIQTRISKCPRTRDPGSGAANPTRHSAKSESPTCWRGRSIRS